MEAHVALREESDNHLLVRTSTELSRRKKRGVPRDPMAHLAKRKDVKSLRSLLVSDEALAKRLRYRRIFRRTAGPYEAWARR